MSSPARLLPFRRASSLSPSVALARVTAATLPVAALRARCPRARTIAARALSLPPAGVRASCGRARPATQTPHTRRAPIRLRSDVAVGHAQSACGTMRNARGIVWGSVYASRAVPCGEFCELVIVYRIIPIRLATFVLVDRQRIARRGQRQFLDRYQLTTP